MAISTVTLTEIVTAERDNWPMRWPPWGGIGMDERVATLAWNSYQHMES